MNTVMYLYTSPWNNEWTPTVSLGDFDSFMWDIYDLFAIDSINSDCLDQFLDTIDTDWNQEHGVIRWRKG